MPPIQFNAHKRYHLLKSTTRLWESCGEQRKDYRLIFILSGKGKFILDGQIHAYQPKGIIFLQIEQQLLFQQDKETEIFVIAFDTYLADDFQKKKQFSPDFADTYKQAEHLCTALQLTQGQPVSNQKDSQTVSFMISQILFELGQQPASHLKMIRGCIELIVTVLARNNFKHSKIHSKPLENDLTDAIVEHLKEELLQNRTIRIPNVLLKFNISEDVANLCVLNRTGMSLRNFIFKYKADLFKARMLKRDVMEFASYL